MRTLGKALLVLFWFIIGGILLALRGETSAGDASAEGEEDRPASSRGSTLKRRAIQAVLVLLAIGAGAFLVVASGVIPIKASSGHWAITRWFLDFAKVRSVSTHTLGKQAPPLEDPALVLKGAGHYEFGCRPCHGAVERPQPVIPHEMTPHPPFLPERVPRWDSAELFYIVKHGIKFTGMPAWPAQERDDEVWAVAAFLQTLPGLTAEEYERLTWADLQDSAETPPLAELSEPRSVPDAVIESCARCHGLTGRGRGTGAFPKLAGQSHAYLLASLKAYARGQRHSGIMQPLASGLGTGELSELASYYAALEGLAPAVDAAERSEELPLGERIAREGLPRQKVPACIACHGPGNQPRNPIYPQIAGQYADYLVLQLELFKHHNRGGTTYSHLMHPVVEHLTKEQMRAVALYYESLGERETAGD